MSSSSFERVDDATSARVPDGCPGSNPHPVRRVPANHTSAGRHVVELANTSISQLGEVTSPGQGTVILPSSEYGSVELLRPSAELQQRCGAEVGTEGARLQREPDVR